MYGFAWWIIGGLMLMPISRYAAFAPLMMPPMRMVAMGSLVGHLIYGYILGGAFAGLYKCVRHRAQLHA